MRLSCYINIYIHNSLKQNRRIFIEKMKRKEKNRIRRKERSDNYIIKYNDF